MSVCPEGHSESKSRELSSRTVFVLSGDLKLSKDTSKNRTAGRSIDCKVSKSWLRQPRESSQIWLSIRQIRLLLAITASPEVCGTLRDRVRLVSMELGRRERLESTKSRYLAHRTDQERKDRSRFHWSHNRFWTWITTVWDWQSLPRSTGDQPAAGRAPWANLVPGEARLSRLANHNATYRFYKVWVTPSSEQENQNGREMSSRMVFVRSGDLILFMDTSKKPGPDVSTMGLVNFEVYLSFRPSQTCRNQNR